MELHAGHVDQQDYPIHESRYSSPSALRGGRTEHRTLGKTLGGGSHAGEYVSGLEFVPVTSTITVVRIVCR